MHIMFVSAHTSPAASPGRGDAGGMNVYILELSRQLASLGHHISFVTRRTSTSVPESVPLEPGIHLFSLQAGAPAPLAKSELPPVMPEFGLNLANLLQSNSFIEQFGAPDIVHSHYWLSALAVEATLRELKVMGEDAPATAITFHTLATTKSSAARFELQGKEVALAAGGERVLAEAELIHSQQAQNIIPVSESERWAIGEIAGEVRADSPPNAIVTPGVDTAFFRPNNQEVRGRGPNSRYRLAVVGRVQPFKAQHFALNVVSKLIPLLPDSVIELTLGGSAPTEDAAYELALRETVTALQLEANVLFTSTLSREQVREIFSEADLTVIPSLSESFGMVALESAACGTPVIATNTGGLANSVAHNLSGILLDDRDPEVWAQEIAQLLLDSDRLSSLSESARTFAEQHTWSTSAQVLLKNYEQLLSS